MVTTELEPIKVGKLRDLNAEGRLRLSRYQNSLRNTDYCGFQIGEADESDLASDLAAGRRGHRFENEPELNSHTKRHTSWNNKRIHMSFAFTTSIE
ncbi:hypothetical protein EVAR_53874_1 [Eumeta japonica]|uniref:Uncharacterized protein n=1 Tax=Eumeta variegata TaxID=151549 RepID=A0A4C1XE01_EUMVA|nr:hypothetical protein EVAR_53874_1 [Eumeta japonica]